jgi:hypothetical protein
MRRLHPRGADSRGAVIDAEGAMLGPDCVLVRRTPRGFCCIGRAEVAAIQIAGLGQGHDPDWLFDQCRRIAHALADGETALAQILGLRIPLGDLDGAALRRLGAVARLSKANFNPDQLRIPPGEPGAGQWTDEGNASTAVAERDRKSICIERCAQLLARPLPYRWSDQNTFAFHRCVNDCMSAAG